MLYVLSTAKAADMRDQFVTVRCLHLCFGAAGLAAHLMRLTMCLYYQLFLSDTFWAMSPSELKQKLTDDTIEARRLPEIETETFSALDLLLVDNFTDQVSDIA